MSRGSVCECLPHLDLAVRRALGHRSGSGPFAGALHTHEAFKLVKGEGRGRAHRNEIDIDLRCGHVAALNWQRTRHEPGTVVRMVSRPAPSTLSKWHTEPCPASVSTALAPFSSAPHRAAKPASLARSFTPAAWSSASASSPAAASRAKPRPKRSPSATHSLRYLATD